MFPEAKTAKEYIDTLFPKKVNSVRQFYVYKLKAIKILGNWIGLWGPLVRNPYESGKLPLEKDLILKLFWRIHDEDIQKHQYVAAAMLLDYYFPPWRAFATKECIGSGVQRRDGINRVWRNEVLKRDNHACVECGAKNNLQAHHIYEWSEFPGLRIDVDNGITLCGTCHHEMHPQMAPEIFNKNLKNN